MSLQSTSSDWRQAHVGHWLAQASQRFERRVWTLMAASDRTPLALANLAARGRLTASHMHITRHVAVNGTRLTELAQRAGVTKQAMGKLVDQCVAWGLVSRLPDMRDARAILVVFTPLGRAWLQAYDDAVHQAQDEMRAAVGDDVATVIALGLEIYAA